MKPVILALMALPWIAFGVYASTLRAAEGSAWQEIIKQGGPNVTLLLMLAFGVVCLKFGIRGLTIWEKIKSKEADTVMGLSEIAGRLSDAMKIVERIIERTPPQYRHREPVGKD